MRASTSSPGSSLKVPSSYADQIAEILEHEILRGQFPRGAHLQQDEICRRFEVSRTPAREALRKLQTLGLVQLVPNKGAMIQMPTLAELSQTYEVRAELEGFAAELATRHRTDELVRRLVNAQEALARAVDAAQGSRDVDGASASDPLKDLNDDFHQLIHGAGGNPRLQSLIRDLERYFPKDTVRRAITLPADLQRFYVAEHEEILEEMVAGRAIGARDAMRHHIHQSQAMLLDYLRDIGFDD